MSTLWAILSNGWGELSIHHSPGSVGLRIVRPDASEAWLYFDLTCDRERAALEQLTALLQALAPASLPQSAPGSAAGGESSSEGSGQ